MYGASAYFLGSPIGVLKAYAGFSYDGTIACHLVNEDKLGCGLSGSPTSASSKIISPDGIGY